MVDPHTFPPADQWLSVVHDLRQPLTVIKVQADLLHRTLSRGGPMSPEELRHALETIRVAAERMRFMLEEMASDTFDGAVTPRPALVDLVSLVREAVVELKPGTAGRDFAVDAASPELLIPLDPGRMHRVLDNLLSNAIKYSHFGTLIRVTVGLVFPAEGPSAIVSVQDEGIGIPAAEVARVFDRSYRASNVVESAIPGHGLGLWGARQIVEQHGGNLTVASTEGVGSTFTVRIPAVSPR